jgi:hypothetical protein
MLPTADVRPGGARTGQRDERRGLPTHHRCGRLSLSDRDRTNPCSAVRINSGDGDAITYAITVLPITQTQVYQKAGNYTITAEGMGNCGGAPTTTLVVSAPLTRVIPRPPPSFCGI